MKNAVTFLRQILLLLSVLVLFSHCKKDSSNNDSTTSEIVNVQNKRLEKVVPDATTSAFLLGIVLDENGNPLSDVEVVTGDKSQITDSEGIFVFGEITLNKDYTVVSAQKTGFMKGFRTFSPTTGAINKVEIRLQSRGVAQNINAANGGEVIFESGKVKLNFPVGSIADAEGKPYSGDVKVFAKYINPDSEGFSSTMPGSLIGLTDNNELSGMISYGMANVELTDNIGNPLQVAGGKKVKITMPAIKDAPTEMPVWHFNEKYGLWVEAGRAAKTGSNYSFEANHFSAWNLDVYANNSIAKVTITLNSSTNQAIANQKIDIYTSDFKNRLRTVFTDNNGQFTLLQSPRNLRLRIITGCQNIDKTLAIDNENETVTLSNLTGNVNLYKIIGKAKDCEINYVNSYFALTGLTESKISFNGKTDANGAFETSIIMCDLDSSTNYPVRATVYTANNTVKIDTIEISFSSTTLQKDINFCESVEVLSPYLNPALTYGSVTDIDGNKYATIKIGTQTWMAQNLNVSRYNDGTPIPNIINNTTWENLTTGAYSYYENLPTNGAIYGKLYNQFAVNSGKLCPLGWSIPNLEDWFLLIEHLGGSLIAGGKLKAIGNTTDSTGLWASPNDGATNESGFSGLGGGGRWWDGSFTGIVGGGVVAYFWGISSDSPIPMYYLNLSYSTSRTSIDTFDGNRVNGNSCRCLKD
jgi:uncharacterized protein (TIGR02145 family)